MNVDRCPYTQEILAELIPFFSLKSSKDMNQTAKVGELRFRCRPLGSPEGTPWMAFQDDVWDYLPEDMEFFLVGGVTPVVT